MRLRRINTGEHFAVEGPPGLRDLSLADVGHAPRLQRDRVRDQLLALPKQIAVRIQVERRQQSAHRPAVRLQRSIGEDVLDRSARGVERPRHQKRPMAVQRFLLRAHERDAVSRSCIDDAGDAVTKTTRRGDPFIVDTPSLVTDGIVRAAAELTPAEGITNAASIERRFQRLSVEMRSEATVWRGPHVGHGSDPMLRQQRQEPAQ